MDHTLFLLPISLGDVEAHPAAFYRQDTLALPRIAMTPHFRAIALDTLWFQVAGTNLHIECRTAFISRHRTNRSHEMLSARGVRFATGRGAGNWREGYYFTGGEPFLNRRNDSDLAATLQLAPRPVAENGMLLRKECSATARSERLNLDTPRQSQLVSRATTPSRNDAIRWAGVWDLRMIRPCQSRGGWNIR